MASHGPVEHVLMVCGCRYIMAKGLLGRRNLTIRVAGGASTLRRFHLGHSCGQVNSLFTNIIFTLLAVVFTDERSRELNNC